MAWYNSIPIIGGFFDSPEQEAQTNQFKAMAQAYEKYRQFNADASQQRMASQLQMTGPLQQYLHGMLPDLQPFDTQGALDAFKNVTNNRGPSVVASSNYQPGAAVMGPPPPVRKVPG